MAGPEARDFCLSIRVGTNGSARRTTVICIQIDSDLTEKFEKLNFSKLSFSLDIVDTCNSRRCPDLLKSRDRMCRMLESFELEVYYLENRKSLVFFVELRATNQSFEENSSVHL